MRHSHYEDDTTKADVQVGSIFF